MSKLVNVIETQLVYGRGDNDFNPTRVINQYWSTDGELLAANGPGTMVLELRDDLVSRVESAQRSAIAVQDNGTACELRDVLSVLRNAYTY